MHWNTMRVVVHNLRQALADMDAGKHLETVTGTDLEFNEPPYEDVRNEWRIMVVSTTKCLANLLHVDDVRGLHRDWERLSKNALDKNPIIKTARRLVNVAEKLIADYDEERKPKTQPVPPTAKP